MIIHDEIITEKCKLQLYRPEMIKQEFVEWINDSEINAFLGTSKYVTHTLEDEIKYVSDILRADDEILLAIIPKDADYVVGNVHLTIDMNNKRCSIAYVLADRRYWGKGIMTDAVRLVTQWAFENLDIVRMDAGFYDANPASGRVLEKNGYVIEGCRRKAGKLYDGSYCNEVLVGLLREEFEKLKC